MPKPWQATGNESEIGRCLVLFDVSDRNSKVKTLDPMFIIAYPLGQVHSLCMFMLYVISRRDQSSGPNCSTVQFTNQQKAGWFLIFLLPSPLKMAIYS